VKVYLDFDDVLAETFRELAAFAAARFGKTPPPGKETHFDLHESLGLSNDEYGVFMERFHAERLLAVEEVSGACETLRAWRKDGIEPEVVTGRPVSAHADSVQWLADRGLSGVPVLHVDKYARFPDPAAPGVLPFPALRERGYGFAVEDAPAALDVLSRSLPCPYAVHERPADGTAPALRTARWEEIDRAVRDLAAREADAR
jgi:hypothetical protein